MSPRFHHKCISTNLVVIFPLRSRPTLKVEGTVRPDVDPAATDEELPDGLVRFVIGIKHASIIFTIINDPPRQSLESRAGPYHSEDVGSANNKLKTYPFGDVVELQRLECL